LEPSDGLTEKWPGEVSKPAFIQFLTKGFISQERPGVFMAFMFSPSRKNRQGKKDRKRNLRNVLGKSGEVDEEDLEYYAKNDFYIPKSVYEGEVQIQMAVRTLDLLKNHKSIASGGYRYRLEFLDGRRNTFHEEQEKDEMFMARYVNLLDTAFQNFSSELASFHTDRDPIRRARSSLRGKMSEGIKRIMRDKEYDVMRNLPLPPLLTEQDRNTGGGKKGKTKDHRETDQESDSERQDHSRAPAPRELPDDIPPARACPTAVRVPTPVKARTDCFIDDLILVFLDTPINRQRQPHSVPLAVYVANIPNAGATEPVPSRN
jgi:hypothetical protein